MISSTVAYPQLYSQTKRERNELLDWQKLPNWCNFFIKLGHCVAKHENKNSRLVVALALPTRSYAAALIASGIILERAYSFNLDNKDRFAELCKLPIGTSICYNRKGELLRAIHEGFIPELNRIKIRTESKPKGGLSYLIDYDEAYTISIANQKWKPNLKKGPHLQKNDSNFLSRIVDKKIAYRYSTNSNLECIIIGNKVALRQEISSQAIKSQESLGSFQDILQIRSFVTSKGASYHTDILSGKRNKTMKGDFSGIVIFDGANAFLKSRDYWLKSHNIVLLDRTEPHFQEAVDVINQNYYSRFDDVSLELIAPPFGVELIAYQEKY